ncbi:hypothetical protein N7491_009928 [Penicillium cf. griseofulvum]|uniref:Uncharacterized protein n=1 Tax=Penicillium cf. griseofulvum TaxID=2972120 RepID=A0A9W9MYX2_9EURO|nr:hypothetical protein N7472_000255 [Penicillium cf. griseofulvum]KAJ5421483.1 hypothetical protein N7491_009928 [Penicillium cf. griseofulvum]KAJ5424715.1 hypothetical protein N7445_010688 [Penicillium cf. griseofulvum]
MPLKQMSTLENTWRKGGVGILQDGFLGRNLLRCSDSVALSLIVALELVICDSLESSTYNIPLRLAILDRDP